MRLAEKGRKKSSGQIPLILNPGKKIPKKITKKLKKIKKPFSGINFCKNWKTLAEKKGKQNFTPEFHSYSTRARKFRKK